MPYLGRGLEKGNYLKLDDISSQFDGSKTTFNLTVGGSAHVPGSSYSLLVSLSGIVQEGEAAYTLDQNEITFAAAPQAADDCFIISLGTPLGIGVPSNGTVNGTQLAKPLNYDNFFHLDHTNDRVGIGTSLPIQSLDVYDGGIAVRDSATGITTLSFYHNRNELKASIDKTGNNLTFENVDSGIIDYKIGGDSRVSIGSTGKIFFAGDDNTYFYRPGADTLAFVTAGTERLRIRSDGHIGIGTDVVNKLVSIKAVHPFLRLEASDTSDKRLDFQVSSSGIATISAEQSSQQLSFKTTGGEALRITSDGKTLIHGDGATGANNTSTLLPNGYTLNIHGTSSNDGISVVRYSADYGAYGINIGKSNNSTFGTNTLVTDGEELGHVSFYGADGTDFNMAAQISAEVDGTPSDGTDMPGTLTFKTSSEASGTPTERLRIDSSGKLGVGDFSSTSIAQALHVRGSQPEIYLEHTGGYDLTLTTNDGMGQNGITVNGGFLSLAYNNKNIVMCRTGGNVGIGTDDPASNMNLHVLDKTDRCYVTFESGGNESSQLWLKNPARTWKISNYYDQNALTFTDDSDERLRIDANGKVGIGTDNPYYKLDVNFNNSDTALSGGSGGNWGGAGLRLENENTTVGSMSLIHFRTGNHADWHVGGKFVGSNNSDLVFLQEGVNEKLRIKNDGKVGIGSAIPDEQLDVAGNIKINRATGDPKLIISGSGHAQLTLTNTTGADHCGVNFGDNDDINAGMIQYTNGSSNDYMVFHTAGSERFRIDKDGRVQVGNQTNNSSITALFGVIADDGEAADLYVGKFHNLEATAGESYGVDIRAGSNSTDHGFRVKNRANDTTQFIVRGDGNIGINTNSPSNLLHIVHQTAGQDVIKLEGKPLAASESEVSKINFQITQSNGQSARLAEIVSGGESGWGGQLIFNVKSSNGTPNNTTDEALRIRSSDAAATNMKMVVDAYLQLGGYNNTNESFANLAVLFSARDMAGSSMVSGQTDTISGYARRRETGDGDGTFFFGPYGEFPPGDYTALFRLKISDRSGSSTVGYIDIIGTGIDIEGRNTAPRSADIRIDIQTNDFTSSDKYQYFALDFSKSNNSAHIETRFLNYNSATADIYLDHVLILPRINHGFEGGSGVFDY